MSTFQVRVGEYEDATFYIVRGVENKQEALERVRKYLKKKYSRSYWDEDECSAEEITITRGVTEL